jgi:RimJ/RimL family protein N-acetyltransferase
MTTIFETERLIAREYEETDAEAAFEIYGDPIVMHFIGTMRVSADVAAERKRLVRARSPSRSDSARRSEA